MKEKPVVYLASPYRGAKAQNEAFARLALAYAIQSGVVPAAPHLLYPQVLNCLLYTSLRLLCPLPMRRKESLCH